MAEFADTVPDARLRRALQDALAGRPGERMRWFALREWLADNGIEPG